MGAPYLGRAGRGFGRLQKPTVPTASADPLVPLFAGLLSGNVSDAMETLGLRRAVITGYLALGPGEEPVVGRAFTIRQHRKHGADDRTANLTKHVQVSRELAQAGDVIVIDTGGIADVATWGEAHSARCLRRGIAGMVTNGATRDAELIRRMRFPAFCRAFSPIKGAWDTETASVNEPVVLDAVQIRPGDIIFADETGIIVIPPVHARQVADLAAQIKLREDAALNEELTRYG
jgi:regulator of RNase E activity RraA